MTEDDFRALCLAFPDTVEGFNMGSTYFKTSGKDLARILGGGRIYFTGVPVEEVEMLTEAEPETFHFTAHYKDYPSVLARIATLHPGSFRNFLDRRFRKIAKKSVVKAWEGEKARAG